MQPPSSAAPPGPPTRPPDTATETVTRPDPGLARGKWEAPVWAFYVVLLVVIVSAAVYVALRSRQRRRARPAA